MNQDRLDSFYNSTADRYDKLNRIPKSVSSDDAKSEPQEQTVDRQIMVALGFIATLLLVSGIRLYYCVNLKSAKAQVGNPNQELTLGDRSIEQR